MDKLFIGIGVSKTHGFDSLPGVWSGIDAIAQWAKDNDHLKVVVTDEGNKDVTPDRIRAAVEPELKLGLGRIIVYFCGHGIKAGSDQYWLLSGDNTLPECRISRDEFRRMLAKWGPKQISVFADACRSPMKFSGMASWVINKRPPKGRVPRTLVESFYSTEDWSPAYAVGDDGRDDGRKGECLFTTVLHEALTFKDTGAVNRFARYPGFDENAQLITSGSLISHLRKAVPDRVAAEAYGRLQNPECNIGLEAPDDIYAVRELPPGAQHEGANRGGIGSEPAPVATTDPDELVGKTASEWRNDFVELAYQSIDSMNLSPLAVRSENLPRVLGFREEVHDMREAQVEQYRFFVFDTDPAHGFIKGSSSSTFLVGAELQNGFNFMPVVAHEELYCALSFEFGIDELDYHSGIPAELTTLGYGSIYMNPEYGRRTDGPEWMEPLQWVRGPGALKALTNGGLSSADRFLVASAARRVKHKDPTLGVVAAYLYDAIGDVDNIRRMCWFYAEYGQDIPFDIALLADLPIVSARGRLTIDIPAIAKADVSAFDKDLPDYVSRATEEVAEAGVAGCMPMTRGGWSRLHTTGLELHRELLDLADELTDASLTTFRGEATMEAMSELLGRCTTTAEMA